jgi:transposase InsO family protein
MPKRTTGGRPELKTVNVGAAAIDIGSKMHMAAVNPACADVSVRSFGTFTQDLHNLADWFKACGVTSVAMESTGIYWIPVYEILEQRGFDVILVNARSAKNVPGRKTDVSDAAWLRELHSYGLLRGSFRPDAEITTLRAYLRHRERLVEYAAAHIQHMQKALMEMNLQLHHVVSDITGTTGMRIIRAIVAGERNPDVLATYRDARCHASIETIRAALVGAWRSRPECRRSAANRELVDDIRKVHRDTHGRYGSPRRSGLALSGQRHGPLQPQDCRLGDGRSLRADLPLAALRMAISAQRPGAGPIHHSDRGVQYASADYRKLMQSAGFRASMSRKADCYDNAPMESFSHTLKTELVHHRQYATRQEATRDIFAYIEGFYNRTCRHSAIGYISPIEMELRVA